VGGAQTKQPEAEKEEPTKEAAVGAVQMNAAVVMREEAVAVSGGEDDTVLLSPLSSGALLSVETTEERGERSEAEQGGEGQDEVVKENSEGKEDETETREGGHDETETREDGHDETETREDGHDETETREDGHDETETREDGHDETTRRSPRKQQKLSPKPGLQRQFTSEDDVIGESPRKQQEEMAKEVEGVQDSEEGKALKNQMSEQNKHDIVDRGDDTGVQEAAVGEGGMVSTTARDDDGSSTVLTTTGVENASGEAAPGADKGTCAKDKCAKEKCTKGKRAQIQELVSTIFQKLLEEEIPTGSVEGTTPVISSERRNELAIKALNRAKEAASKG
jgi:hypothetical protein